MSCRPPFAQPNRPQVALAGARREPARFRRLLSIVALTIAPTTGACAALSQAAKPDPRPPGMDAASASPIPHEVAMQVVPLPGMLDRTPVFNSNSPEIVMEEGITLSTLPAKSEAEKAVYQNVPFSGAFAVFSHHIAKDAEAGARLLHLGLLAHNRGKQAVTLKRLAGASYLSQPEALFKPLDPIIPDPEGLTYAGPGDRVATDLIHGRSPMESATWTIPAGQSRLLHDLPIPTSVAIMPSINGRSSLLRFEASGPVYLSEVAVIVNRNETGGYPVVAQADFERVLASQKLAGPRDLAAVPFDPAGKPPTGFRYGRVAGVSQGDRWEGHLPAALTDLARGQHIGVPIASLYLNRIGTGQNQSATMLSRYPDTAYQAHGNYGATYRISLDLAAPDAGRTFALTLSHPARVIGDKPPTAVVYNTPPGKPVMFRGPIKTTWHSTAGTSRELYTHVVLRHGEEVAPFATIPVAAGANVRAIVELIYPADATPPQLLTVTRVD